MRILFLSDEFPPINLGGAGAVAYDLAKGLKNKGHDVFVVNVVQDRASQSKSGFDGLKIIRIYADYHPRWQAWLSLYNSQTVRKVEEIIKTIKPDIIHAHNIHHYLSYGCLKKAKKYAKGVFLTAHDVMTINYEKFFPKDKNDICKIRVWNQIKEARKRYNPFRNIIIKNYLKYTDKIFAVSNSLKKLLEINGIKNIETVYNGIDVNGWKADLEENRKFQEKYNLQNKKIIFFGGRLSGAKGGDKILEAVALIKKGLENIILVVSGERNKYVEEMEELAKKLNIEKNVIFTGWLDKDELKSAYYNADISVSPSICFETFGMNNLEAMACKKPVISSYFGGPKEVVINEETGYLVDPNDIKLIVKKIIDLLNNSEKAKKFGEAGHLRAREFFSLNRQVEETLRWYNKFLIK